MNYTVSVAIMRKKRIGNSLTHFIWPVCIMYERYEDNILGCLVMLALRKVSVLDI